jgi:hypothetical protein
VIFSTKTVLQTLHEKHLLVLQTYASLRDSANAVPKTSLPLQGGFVGGLCRRSSWLLRKAESGVEGCFLKNALRNEKPCKPDEKMLAGFFE